METPTIRQTLMAHYGSITKLALALGVKHQVAQKWCANNRIPPERAVQIEQASGGAVTRQALRPDLFN